MTTLTRSKKEPMTRDEIDNAIDAIIARHEFPTPYPDDPFTLTEKEKCR